MIGKRVAPPDPVPVSGRGGRADLSIWAFGCGALVLGGGRAFLCHRPRCLSKKSKKGTKKEKGSSGHFS